MVARLGLAALLMTSSSYAVAQGKPKDKKGEKKDEGCKEGSTNLGCKKETKTETKIEAAAPTARAAKPEGKAQKGPALKSTDYDRVSSLQIRSKAKRKEAMGYLDELIKSTPKGDKEMPDLQYQYGEVLYEESKAYNNDARALDDKVFEANKAGNKTEVAKLKKKQAEYEKLAKDKRLEAFKRYKDIIDTYPKYEKRDEVLFYMGYNIKELSTSFRTQAEIARGEGKESEAQDLEAKALSYDEKVRDYYRMLLKEFPKSKYVPDALLEFAEFYFYDNDMDSALKAYQKLVEYPESKVYGYALYKQGWCYFNQGEYQEAIKKFVATVTYSREAAASGDKSRVALEKEAIRDIVRTYAKFGVPEKARSFFQKIGGEDKYKEMMVQLGGFYYEQGQYLDSIEMYEQVIDINPTDNDNYKHQYEICNAALALAVQNQPGAKERIVTEMQTLSKIYQDMKARKAPADKIAGAKDVTA